MRAKRNPINRPFDIEPLESRQLLTAPIPNLPDNQALTATDVTNILAAAASQALPTQVIAVVDRDGQILGMVAMKNAKLGKTADQFGNPDDPLLRTVTAAISRARTGAFFESHEDAFTTRTARFIIQDHFPQPLPNTAGGPLYGVEFSSLPGSDVYSGPAISGDPGGVPLFKNGVPVGGIGVAADNSDRRVREGLPYNPKTLPDPKGNPDNAANLYDGSEESDVDEQVALAGAKAFPTPFAIQATNIFVGGLRFPFLKNHPATKNARRSLTAIGNAGDGTLIMATPGNTGLPFVIGAPYSTQTSAKPRGSPGSPFTEAGAVTTIGGITGELKNTNSRAKNFGIVGSDDTDKSGTLLPDKNRLTTHDVLKVITDAVRQALITRAGIRRPIGTPVRVHVAVVDRDGSLLGVFRMQDGTNFSYDVAVQKARTAAFFSDDTHAFSARTMGFVSQMFFPAGIDNGERGPYFHIQNTLSLGQIFNGSSDFGIENRAATLKLNGKMVNNPLMNGITIFPGGAPLYKNGVFVGAVGVSGDGVDQDDIITFNGTKSLRSAPAVRSDHIGEEKVVNFLDNRLTLLDDLYNLDRKTVKASRAVLAVGLDGVQLPFQKFPRNPEL